MEDNSQRFDARDLGAIGLLLLLVLAANVLLLFSNHAWQDLHGFNYDFESNYMSFRPYLEETYGQGWFPLWRPQWISGIPALALYVPAMLHPSVLFMFLTPLARAVGLNTITHLSLITVFSYLLFRRLGLGRAACMAAALWSGLSGYGAWVSPIIAVLNPVPWFIMWMWSALCFARRPSLSWFLVHTAAVWLLLTSGDIPSLIFGGYFGALWLVLAVPGGLRQRTRIIITLCASALMAIIITSAQLLPAATYFSQCLKTAPFTWAAYRDTFPSLPDFPAAAAGLFSKHFRALFFCLAAAVFAAAGIWRARESRAVMASAAVAGLLLLLVGGGRCGFGRLLHLLPLAGSSVRHYKSGMVLQPMIMVLAACGADWFLARFREEPRRVWLIAIIGAAAVFTSLSIYASALLAAVAAAAVIGRWRARGAGALLVVLAFAECAAVLWHPISEFPRWRFWDRYLEAAHEAGHLHRVGVFFPALAAINFDYLHELPLLPGGIYGEDAFESFPSYPPRRYAELLAIIEPGTLKRNERGISFIDFSTPFKSRDFITPENRGLVNLLGVRFLFSKDFSLREADIFPILSDPDYVLNPARMQGFRPFRRVIVPGPEGDRPALEINGSGTFSCEAELCGRDRLRFGIEVSGPADKPVSFIVRGTGPAGSSLWYGEELRAGVREREISPVFGGADSGAALFRLDFTVIFPEGSSSEVTARWLDPVVVRDYKTIKRRAGSRLMMLENVEAMPRGRIVHRVARAADDGEAVEIMRDPGRYDPTREAVVVDPEFDPATIAPAGPGGDEVTLTSFFDDAFDLEARASSPGLLVWAANAYPGWRAWVDGEEARIVHADLAFRGVYLSKGDHRVRFQFMPVDFRVGLFVSIGSILFMLGLIAVGGGRRLRARGPSSPRR